MANSTARLTIDRIVATPFRLPMVGTLRWGEAAAFSEVRHVLVQVTLSDGSTGMAEAPPRPTIYGETIHSILSIIEGELTPRLLGQAVPIDLPAASAPWPTQALSPIRNNNTAKGALDIALHDAAAHHLGRPLAERLGSVRKRVKVSYILGIGELETVLEEAERITAHGVRVLKVKVGRNWEADLQKIVELRKILPTDTEMYADANECFTAENALSRLAQLHEMGLLFCEEPLPVEQIQERAALRAQSLTPLIADDSAFTYRDLRREVGFDTFDILNIKTARTGYTESMQMLQMARHHDKGVMIGSQACSTLGTAQAALLAARPEVTYPSELSFFLRVREEIVDQRLRIEDGYLNLAEAQSVQVDPDLLREAAIDPNGKTD